MNTYLKWHLIDEQEPADKQRVIVVFDKDDKNNWCEASYCKPLRYFCTSSGKNIDADGDEFVSWMDMDRGLEWGP